MFKYKSKLLQLTILVILICFSSSNWGFNNAQELHQYSPAVSSQIAQSIKNKIIKNIDGFVNRPFAQQLLSDLSQSNDGNRKLTKIDSVSAKQLFTLFGIKDPGCDANNDSIIEGGQLKCLNIIWKMYVPQDN